MSRRARFLLRAEETRPAQPTPAELYERTFGKPPHHRMKPETIRARLEAANGDTGECETVGRG